MHRKVIYKEQPAISPSGSHLQLGSYTVLLIPYCCFLYIAHQVILSLELSSHSIGIMPKLIRQVIQSLVSRSTRSTCLTMISMTRWFTPFPRRRPVHPVLAKLEAQRLFREFSGQLHGGDWPKQKLVWRRPEVLVTDCINPQPGRACQSPSVRLLVKFAEFVLLAHVAVEVYLWWWLAFFLDGVALAL